MGTEARSSPRVSTKRPKAANGGELLCVTNSRGEVVVAVTLAGIAKHSPGRSSRSVGAVVSMVMICCEGEDVGVEIYQYEG